MTEDWYEQMIEEPIRNLVKLLRDNGFNTTCSCGHEMEIECGFFPGDDIKRLDDLLFNSEHRNYSLTWHIDRVDGYLSSGLFIKIRRC